MLRPERDVQHVSRPGVLGCYLAINFVLKLDLALTHKNELRVLYDVQLYRRRSGDLHGLVQIHALTGGQRAVCDAPALAGSCPSLLRLLQRDDARRA